MTWVSIFRYYRIRLKIMPGICIMIYAGLIDHIKCKYQKENPFWLYHLDSKHDDEYAICLWKWLGLNTAWKIIRTGRDEEKYICRDVKGLEVFCRGWINSIVYLMMVAGFLNEAHHSLHQICRKYILYSALKCRLSLRA